MLELNKEDLKSVGIVGCGNMSQAFFGSILSHNKNSQARKILTYTPSKNRAIELATKVGGHQVNNLSYMKHVDILCFCFKPQQFESFIKEAKEIDFSDKTIISIMAGIDIKTIQDLTGVKSVLRIMPSMPVEKKQGITLLHASKDTSENMIKEVEKLSQDFSLVIRLEEEKLFDQLTLVTSSGPAFVYYLLSSFQKKVEEMGIKKDDAMKIVLKLFEGSLSVVKDSSFELEDLMTQVTSNKGVTAEGLSHLHQTRVGENVAYALEKGFMRSLQIKEEIHSALPKS